MARLIDAQNLLNQYERIDWYSVSKEGQLMRGATMEDNPFIHYYDGEEIIKNAPTVDAVEVVRCQECKHHYWEQEPCHGKSVHYCKLPHMSGVEVFKDFFCYYGERKEGADNG